MTQLTITTANVRSNPIQRRAAVRRRIAQAMGLGGVVFGQELSGRKRPHGAKLTYLGLFVSFAHDRGKLPLAGHYQTPVAIPEHFFTQLSTTYVSVHGARPSPGTPERGIVCVRARSLDGRALAFVNVWPINKPGRGSRPEVRRQLWDSYWAKLVDLVGQLHREGRDVVIAGDFNSNKLPGGFAYVIAARRGYDHVLVSVAKPTTRVRVTARRFKSRTVAMDHPIVNVTLVLG